MYDDHCNNQVPKMFGILNIEVHTFVTLNYIVLVKVEDVFRKPIESWSFKCSTQHGFSYPVY